MERNFTQPIVTHRLQSLLCCAARALFQLKSAIILGRGAQNKCWQALVRSSLVIYQASRIIQIVWHLSGLHNHYLPFGFISQQDNEFLFFPPSRIIGHSRSSLDKSSTGCICR